MTNSGPGRRAAVEIPESTGQRLERHSRGHGHVRPPHNLGEVCEAM
jgi:hypothetical protein